MERPDLDDTMKKAKEMLDDLERVLSRAQETSSRARLGVAVAIELNSGKMSFDQVIKGQIYTEAMGHTFARVIEARTHLGVAMKALSETAGG